MLVKEKKDILIQAENKARYILKDKGLIVPFKVYLEDKKDILLAVPATYKSGSSAKGNIEIFIKSYLIGKKIDRILESILHEYSHAIYEEGYLINPNLGYEITKLLSKYINLSKNGQEAFHIPTLKDYELEKEYFCAWFASYLMDVIPFGENKDKIEDICRKIIQNFNQNHA